MVSVTNILRSGPWGPGPQRHWWPKGKDRTEGTRHVGFWRRDGVGGGGVEWGSGTSAQLGRASKAFCLLRRQRAQEGPPPPPAPPRAQGKVAVLGLSPGLSSQCLQPTCGSLEIGVGGSDKSVKHNQSPGGTKEGRSQGWGRWPSRSTCGVPTSHSHRATGWGCLLLSRGDPAS